MTVPEQSHAIEEIDAIVAHLRMLVSKEKRGGTSPIRQGFDELAANRMLTAPQMRAVFGHASKTGKTEVNGTMAQMWPFFHDGFSKITMAYEALQADQRIEPLLDAILLSRWNAGNFPKVLGFDVPQNIPDYPASLQQLRDFRLVPAYVEKSVMPHLKNALAAHIGTDIATLDKIVAEREDQLVRNGIPGYEALSPIKDWPQGKKKPVSQHVGQEAKPL